MKVVSVKDGVRLLSRINDSEYRYLRADTTTHTLQVIDYAHHEIHGGSMFRVQAYNDSIANGGTLIIAFKVPDQTKEPHLVFEWETESTGYIELLEGVAITASTGSDRAPKNSNRNSANISVLQGYATGSWVSGYVTIDPTISGGTTVSRKQIYSNAKAGGSDGSRRSEIVLKPNTDYALRFTSSDISKGAQLRCEWYEHTPKT